MGRLRPRPRRELGRELGIGVWVWAEAGAGARAEAGLELGPRRDAGRHCARLVSHRLQCAGDAAARKLHGSVAHEPHVVLRHLAHREQRWHARCGRRALPGRRQRERRGVVGGVGLPEKEGPLRFCGEGARGDRAGAGADRCGVVDGRELLVVLLGRPAARRGPPREETTLHVRRHDNHLSGD
jgi:hypothetical protein